MKFAQTFNEFPPLSIPAEFQPATIMEDTLHEIKVKKKVRAPFPIPAGTEGKVKN